MEAKLIKDRLFLRKVVDSYVLHRIKDSILTIEGDSQYTIGGIEPFYKLSLKNCQAIELGYDLDELADECSIDWNGEVMDGSCGIYKEGFQKALSILGDKKFSEEDIIDCWETAHQAGRFEEKGIAETNWQTAINYAQSLQQTEWDVEIVMDTDCTGEFKYFLLDKGKPLLDADGCIILKRK